MGLGGMSNRSYSMALSRAFIDIRKSNLTWCLQLMRYHEISFNSHIHQ